MSEFDWTGLGEISGFGGDYEDGCRRMVKAGVGWLRQHRDADPQANVNPNIYGVMFDTNKDMDELNNAMAKECEGCTGAMMQACTSHVLYIWKHGLDRYADEMKKE